MQRKPFFLFTIVFVLFSISSSGAEYKKFVVSVDEFVIRFKTSYPYYFYPSKQGKKNEQFIRKNIFGKRKKLKISDLKQKLKTFKANLEFSELCLKPEALAKKIECPLCLESKNGIVIASCGHFFCSICLLKHHCSALRKSKKCPFCIKKLGESVLRWLRKRKRYREFKQKFEYEHELEDQERMTDLLYESLMRMILRRDRRGSDDQGDDDVIDFILL